jgi:hypothetical protein
MRVLHLYELSVKCHYRTQMYGLRFEFHVKSESVTNLLACVQNEIISET